MSCMNCGSDLREGVRFCPKCGTQVAQAAAYAPPPAEPLRTSWDAGAAAPPRRKSRAGKILLVIFGLLFVIGAGVAVAAYFGVRYVADTVKSSEPYQLAERELRESRAAADALGDIKSTGFPVGSFKTQAGGTGHAAFTMTVEGAKASGRYVVVLTREGGRWQVTSGVLRMDDGAVVVVAGDGEGGGHGIGTGAGGGTIDMEGDDVPPPPPPPPGGKHDPVKVRGAVSAGALDAKAVSKPEATYPAVAKAARASGSVVVQVTVDETGQVILASAVSGHPLLQPAAVAAARRARFAPTLTTGGKPAHTIGTLTYKFELPAR